MIKRFCAIYPSIFLIIIYLTCVVRGENLARIKLYNLTGWSESTKVEIPIGRISSPGLIDWEKTLLICNGKELPFAIHEGKAHWKASLKAPIVSPRAEDILVFCRKVSPGEWIQVDVISGKRRIQSAMTQENNNIIVSYPDFKAVINKNTALLQELTSAGKSVLNGPLRIVPYELTDNGYEFTGNLGAAGYLPAEFKIHKKAQIRYKAQMTSSSSTEAMTEINFVIATDSDIKMAITYRIYTNGYMEILADGRPWQGPSPWGNHAVEFSLSVKGVEEKLTHFEQRFPFYGYKDSEAAVINTGRLYIDESVSVLVFGEETINGRKWTRKIHMFSENGKNNPLELAEIADEGLVVQIVPKQSRQIPNKIEIVTIKQARIPAQNLATKLNKIGFDAEVVSESSNHNSVVFELLTEGQEEIAQDGFAIIPRDINNISVKATTIFGLYKASNEIASFFQFEGPSNGFPLIARNPVVSLRGGGLGGGRFEVDVPYSSEKNWKFVFEQLLDSGMNSFWCLGMWGNWKFPVSYKYLPELRSDSPDAYDEVTGTEFVKLEYYRQHGLELADYLHERGAKVFLWMPIGCVPNTFADAFPDGVAPGKDVVFWGRRKITPCPSSDEYQNYIKAFVREIIETYSIDGFVMVRDDNGEICSCYKCKIALESSPTQNQAWDQHLRIYDILRAEGFKGLIAVYPYNDGYDVSKLENILPNDLYIVGHGGGASVLSRSYELIGPMPDTWLDNLYANFRLPASSRMRRLLSDRGTLWVGGAYEGTELPWEAIGYFGWEPTATPNTFRYEWGRRKFGQENAFAFVQMNNAYEQLWEFNSLEMLPKIWVQANVADRKKYFQEISFWLTNYKESLENLKHVAGVDKHKQWFGHLDVFAPFIEYHLHRLDLFAQIYDLILANRNKLDDSEGLPSEVRSAILYKYDQMFEWLNKYGQVIKKAPGDMLQATCRMFKQENIYNEWVVGYSGYLDNHLEIKQFAGSMNIWPNKFQAGKEFSLKIELHNQGVLPWKSGIGQALTLQNKAKKIGLPLRWDYEGGVMAPGDRRVVHLSGKAPKESGEVTFKISFTNPYRSSAPFIEKEITLAWGDTNQI